MVNLEILRIKKIIVQFVGCAIGKIHMKNKEYGIINLPPMYEIWSGDNNQTEI